MTAFSSEGSTCPCEGDWDELLLLELLELLELELPPDCCIWHGGTTSRSIELFSAITSWFCDGGGVPCGVLPPGDMRIVLTACWLWLELELELEEELDELLELLLEVVCCAGQGGTATVWARVPFGTMMVVEPAGGFAVGCALPTPPDGCPVLFCCEPPVGQGGMLISMSFRCLARITVRVPGVCSAEAIGSVDDELLLELELPHPPNATVSAAAAASPSPVRATELVLPTMSSLRSLAVPGVPTRTGAVGKPR